MIPIIRNVALVLAIPMLELLFTKLRTDPKIAQHYGNNNGNNGNE